MGGYPPVQTAAPSEIAHDESAESAGSAWAAGRHVYSARIGVVPARVDLRAECMRRVLPKLGPRAVPVQGPMLIRARV